MSDYTISSLFDKNRIFILQKGELEKRWDPDTYHPERREIIKALKTSGHKLEPLKFVSLFRKNIVKEIPEDVSYVGLENIEGNTGSYIATTEKESISSAIEFKKGQVLFPKLRPYLNKVHFAEFDGVCSTEFHVLDSNKVTNEYLANFLRTQIVVTQTKHLMSGNTLPRLQTDDIESLLIPILAKVEERQVNEIMLRAFEQKQKNEVEAQKLLLSINDYLLKELGIVLPKPQGETLKERIFTSTYKQLSSKRFDPFYYRKYFTELEKSVKNSRYDLVRLSSICNLQNGYAFKSSDYINYSNTLNIRMSNIRPDNYFDPDYNAKYLPDEFAKLYKDFLLKDGDILIAMTDMASDPKILGVPTAVQNSNCRNLLLNQRVGKLYDFNARTINIWYLKEILSSKIIKEYYNKVGARGVQININREQILSAYIPIPPISKQEEIAENIKEIRQQAHKLKAKIAEALAKANKEIENLILKESK